MREPAFSFILQVIAAMILLVDILAALSITTPTLQNNQRDATDPQLRMQGSREEQKVIGDEERMLPHENVEFHLPSTSLRAPVEFHLPSTSLRAPVELPLFPTAATSRFVIDEKFYRKFLTQVKKPDPAIETKLMAMVEKARGLTGASNGMKWEQMDPYFQVILYTAYHFRQNWKKRMDEATWKSHFFGWFLHGFTRDEIECMKSYDRVVFQAPTRSLLSFEHLVEDEDLWNIRAANLVAFKTFIRKRIGTPSAGPASSEKEDWSFLFDQWIYAGYERSKVEKYLIKCFQDANEVPPLMEFTVAEFLFCFTFRRWVDDAEDNLVYRTGSYCYTTLKFRLL
ncbi:hypothetical protein Plhal703r1_c20g0089701 [Plasmopara halstedii]